MSEHVVSPKTYLLIFGALMALTATTVGVALLDLGPFNTIVALVVALIKATLVILIFMHVRYSKRIVPLVILGGLLWLGILIGLTMTDFLSRDWLGPLRPPV
jgi:cytochrome c oxidase subunit 4